MSKDKKTTDAIEILDKLIFKGDPEREKSVQVSELGFELAQLVYDGRKKSGMSQSDLSLSSGLCVSIIHGIENNDYDDCSIRTLHSIATALNMKLTICIE